MSPIIVLGGCHYNDGDTAVGVNISGDDGLPYHENLLYRFIFKISDQQTPVCVCLFLIQKQGGQVNRSNSCFERRVCTRPGVNKVKPKGWIKYSL